MNSTFAFFALKLINPTVHVQAGDLGRLPIPREATPNLLKLVDNAIASAKLRSQENETTYDFIHPVRSVSDFASQQEHLNALEDKIDAEISRLYALSEDDLAAIDGELNGAPVAAADEEAGEDAGDDDASEAQVLELSQDEISRNWISYAIGTVLGRFEIGNPGGLGRGDFPDPVAAEIRKLAGNDGIMPCEAGHAQDLAVHTLACLTLMLGADAARETIRTGVGEGDPLDALRGWLDRFTGQPAQSFWRYHFQQYRKRPVYWPFQSCGRDYTVWVFHEKVGPDTLFRVREFAEDRLRLAERESADLRGPAAKDRKVAKKLDQMLDFADDLRVFVERLKTVVERGYTPHIDDGVLLNAAPLHEVLPSWPETRTAWTELAAGKYDWAHQAMVYWPDRVRAACLTNKSFAIAHGLAVPQPENPQTAEPKRRGRKRKV